MKAVKKLKNIAAKMKIAIKLEPEVSAWADKTKRDLREEYEQYVAELQDSPAHKRLLLNTHDCFVEWIEEQYEEEHQKKASKPYKVIIIDAEKKQVYESTAHGLSDLQKAVDGRIELAHEIEVKGNLVDTIFVNDEGLFGAQNFFEFKGAHQPFAGNGVVVGSDLDSGDSIDVHSSLNEIKSKVKFLSLQDVRSKYDF